MHVVWSTAVIAIVVILVGLAFVFARKPIARFAEHRQRKYYPGAARQALAAQAKPTYYLVLGLIVTLIGLVVAVGSLRR